MKLRKITTTRRKKVQCLCSPLPDATRTRNVYRGGVGIYFNTIRSSLANKCTKILYRLKICTLPKQHVKSHTIKYTIKSNVKGVTY